MAQFNVRAARSKKSRFGILLSSSSSSSNSSFFSRPSAIVSYLLTLVYMPPQQTKVVDHGLGPLKAGPTRLCVPVCNHDAASSKPSSVGRDVVDIHQQTKCDCVVNVCGSKRCKT